LSEKRGLKVSAKMIKHLLAEIAREDEVRELQGPVSPSRVKTEILQPTNKTAAASVSVPNQTSLKQPHMLASVPYFPRTPHPSLSTGHVKTTPSIEALSSSKSSIIASTSDEPTDHDIADALELLMSENSQLTCKMARAELLGAPGWRVSEKRMKKLLREYRDRRESGTSPAGTLTEPKSTPGVGAVLAQAEATKTAGSESFKLHDYAAATAKWTHAINCLNGFTSDAKVLSLRCALFNNRAFANLKLEKFDTVEADVSAVLQVEPDNSKALFRRGQARCALRNWEGAVEDLRRVVQLQPDGTTGRIAANELLEAEMELEHHLALHPKERVLPQFGGKSRTLQGAGMDDDAEGGVGHEVIARKDCTGTALRLHRVTNTDQIEAGTADSRSSPIRKIQIFEVDDEDEDEDKGVVIETSVANVNTDAGSPNYTIEPSRHSVGAVTATDGAPADILCQWWDCNGQDIADDDIAGIVDSLDSRPETTTLDLRNNSIGDRGLQMLCVRLAMGCGANLKTVLFQGNQQTGIGRECAGGVAALRPTLTIQLGISRERIPDAEPRVPTPQGSGPPATTAGSAVASCTGARQRCCCWLRQLTAENKAAGRRPDNQTEVADLELEDFGEYCMYTFGKLGCAPLRVEDRVPDTAADGAGALLGDALWGASIALSMWLAQQPGLLDGARVLELGAGLGLPGLLAASIGRSCPTDGPQKVMLSDVHNPLLQIMRDSIRVNSLNELAKVSRLDWDEFRAKHKPVIQRYDVIIGADVVYPREGLPESLAAAALAHLEPAGVLYIMQHGEHPIGGDSFTTRDGWTEFVAKLEAAGDVQRLPFYVAARSDGEDTIEGPNYYFSGEKTVDFELLIFRHVAGGRAGVVQTQRPVQLEDAECLGSRETVFVDVAGETTIDDIRLQIADRTKKVNAEQLVCPTTPPHPLLRCTLHL
jgi:predicted nicotinamide N-methyase